MLHRSITGLFALLLCSINSIALGQLDVFTRYEDYTGGTPRTYPKAQFDKWKKERMCVLVFTEGKEKLELNCPDIWGFKYGGHLFRIAKEGRYTDKPAYIPVGAPFMLISSGDVFLYESGRWHLDAMKKGKTDAKLDYIDMSYKHRDDCGMLSKSLNSDMVFLQCSNPLGWMDEAVLRFVDDNPELAALRPRMQACKCPDFLDRSCLDYVCVTRSLSEWEEQK